MFSKKIQVLIVCIIFCFSAYAQQAETDYISTMRMGPFKLGSKKADIETIIDKPISLNESYEAQVIYKGSVYNLSFYYGEDNPTLSSIKSSDSKLKTKSGVGLGSNKMQILGIYDKFSIQIWNWYDYENPVTPKDKVQGIELRDDDAGTCIMFKTTDRVVNEISVYYNEGC